MQKQSVLLKRQQKNGHADICPGPVSRRMLPSPVRLFLNDNIALSYRKVSKITGKTQHTLQNVRKELLAEEGPGGGPGN